MPNLNIQDMRVFEVQFWTNEEFSEPSEDEGVEFRFRFNVESNYIESDHRLMIKLTAATPDKSEVEYPFYFKVAILGTFNVNESIEPKLLEQLSRINCPAIMFPYARELVSDLTRRAGFPPLYLPVINFVKQARRKQGEAQTEGEEAKPEEPKAPKTKRQKRPSVKKPLTDR